MSVPRSPFRVAAAMSLTAVLALLYSCEPFHSDAANFNRQWERDRKRRVGEMREATDVTAKGAALAGDQLVAALSGTTHVFVYGVSPLGRKGRYVEYATFRPGGTFVFTNSEGTAGPAGATGSWRVQGPRLCIANPYLDTNSHCFTIARTADGRLQYYIDEPGSDSHGLLTKVTDEVRSAETPNN